MVTKYHCFGIDNGLRNIFLGIKPFCLFLRFLRNWNFQHLFEKEFCEISQNFSSIRQPIENNNCLNELRFCEVSQKSISSRCSISFLSWKTKKFYSLKNIFYAKIDPKDGTCCLNFQWRFCLKLCKFEQCITFFWAWFIGFLKGLRTYLLLIYWEK